MNSSVHVKYFERHLLTPLPRQYTSFESQRISLGYLCLCGLDLLKDDTHHQDKDEHEEWGDWIYSLQDHEFGGFRGSPTQAYSNVASTFFALMSLAQLKDSFDRVEVDKLVDFLVQCQCPDRGIFAPFLCDGGQRFGETDLRYTYCALGARYAMPRSYPRKSGKQDIDLLKTAHYILSCQNYNGGFGNAPYQESHAGLTFCALGSLEFIARLAPSSFSIPASVRSRAIAFLTGLQQAPSGGFSGRPNKPCDSCYFFWCLGSLHLLHYHCSTDHPHTKDTLLAHFQCPLTGGFSKLHDTPLLPDPLHSYLSLCAISLLSNNNNNNTSSSGVFDPLFVIPHGASNNLYLYFSKK